MFTGTISGRLVRDVEKNVYNSKSGAILCRSTLAVEVGFDKDTKQPKVNYIDIVCFGNIAEYMASYGRKGNGFILSGDIEIQTYDKKDGSKGVSTQMNVKSYQMYSNLLANEYKQKQQTKVASTPIEEANQDIAQVPFDNGSTEINDDDLPF